MRIAKFHPEVRLEVSAAAAYIESERHDYGEIFRTEFAEAVEQICRRPEVWRVRKFKYRKYLMARFKFLIWYRERD